MKAFCGFFLLVLIWLTHLTANAQDVTSKHTLTPEDRAYLLNLARNALVRELGGTPIKEPGASKLSPALLEQRGCFVTLEKKGNLRGCIGYIQPIKPLCDCVAENAVNAALHDPRFPEVDAQELNDITIEISALSVPESLTVQNRNTFVRDLVPGRDGVILTNGWKTATFLPQVWEQFNDKTSFLNALCEKGGMPCGCWEDKDTEIFIYHADVFKENRR